MMIKYKIGMLSLFHSPKHKFSYLQDLKNINFKNSNSLIFPDYHNTENLINIKKTINAPKNALLPAKVQNQRMLLNLKSARYIYCSIECYIG